jgi:hypothetical protein
MLILPSNEEDAGPQWGKLVEPLAPLLGAYASAVGAHFDRRNGVEGLAKRGTLGHHSLMIGNPLASGRETGE